ncbi:hypothetical protein GX441_07040 [bacterium]|nr:hypothetical protein [bacterium]
MTRAISGIIFGLIVAWIGVWIYLGNIYPQLLAFKTAWPLIFSMLGLLMLGGVIASAIKRRRWFSGWGIFWGLIIAAFGIGLWLSNALIIPVTFAQWWPVIIVILGITIIVSVIVKALSRPRNVTVIIDKLEEGKIDVDTAVEEIRKTRGRRDESFGVTVDIDNQKKGRRRHE